MNIALTTFNDSNYNSLYNITGPTKQKYCEKWGLSYEYVQTRPGNHFWEKPRIFLEMLQKYDAVIYIECDAAIMNQDFDVRPYIEEHEFIVTTDLNGINCGTYIARSTDLVKQFFYAVNTTGLHFFRNHQWGDQEACRYFLASPPYDKLATYMPQNFMCSNLNSVYGYPAYIKGDYRPGDWIVHLSGISLQQRCSIFKTMLEV